MRVTTAVTNSTCLPAARAQAGTHPARALALGGVEPNFDVTQNTRQSGKREKNVRMAEGTLCPFPSLLDETSNFFFYSFYLKGLGGVGGWEQRQAMRLLGAKTAELGPHKHCAGRAWREEGGEGAEILPAWASLRTHPRSNSKALFPQSGKLRMRGFCARSFLSLKMCCFFFSAPPATPPRLPGAG